MDENRETFRSEVDDSQNPTAAAPYSPEATDLTPAGGATSSTGHPDTGTGPASPTEGLSESTAQAWEPVLDQASGGSGARASSSRGSSGSAESTGSSGWGTADAGGTHPVVSQLQTMIDSVANQARPVLREIAAKAAELAAAAGEKAGPAAHRAAETAGAVGQRVAAKSKEVAADLRSGSGASRGSGTGEAGISSSADRLPDEDESNTGTPAPGT